MIRNTVISLAIVALLGACDPDGDALALACAEYHDPEQPPASPAEAGITLMYTSGLAVDHTVTEFVLAGAAEHEHDFAIRRIQVAGVDATSQGFNFSQWTVSLKLAALRTLPRDAQGRAELAVSVTDACGTYVAAPLAITMDVPSFTLATSYPHKADYIPDDGVTEAVLTISADRGAAGSEVRVSAEPREGLTFVGLPDDKVTLVAAGDRAQAQVRVVSTRAGDAALQVRSASALMSTTLSVAAPPRFVAQDLVLSPGAVRDVTVLSDGALLKCWATSAPGLTVTLAGADLTKSPASAADDPHAWVLTLATDEMLVDGTATVTCSDTFFRETALLVGLEA